MKEKLSENNPLERDGRHPPETPLAIIPPQYEGLPSEVLEEIWTVPVYVDSEKTKSELARKQAALDMLRVQESTQEMRTEDVVLSEANDQVRISELENQLGISKPDTKNQKEVPGENIESLSIEDFATWLAEEAKKSGKSIGESQAYDALTARPEFRKARIASAFGDSEPILKIFHDNEKELRDFTEKTRSEMTNLDGVEYVSATWDHYRIRDERKTESKSHKGYITISQDHVLTKFSPQIRHEIVKSLRDQGYNGQVKFPVTGSRALFSYDNIVLHGNNENDVAKGIEIVQKTLESLGVKSEEPRYGVDAEGADGKKSSYTNRIAQLVERATKESDLPLTQELEKLKS